MIISFYFLLWCLQIAKMAASLSLFVTSVVRCQSVSMNISASLQFCLLGGTPGFCHRLSRFACCGRLEFCCHFGLSPDLTTSDFSQMLLLGSNAMGVGYQNSLVRSVFCSSLPSLGILMSVLPDINVVCSICDYLQTCLLVLVCQLFVAAIDFRSFMFDLHFQGLVNQLPWFGGCLAQGRLPWKDHQWGTSLRSSAILPHLFRFRVMLCLGCFIAFTIVSQFQLFSLSIDPFKIGLNSCIILQDHCEYLGTSNDFQGQSVKVHNHQGLGGYRAVRIGEADHPGPTARRPAPMQLNLAIVNPTTVHSKTPTFMELFTKIGVQIVSLSETAATSYVQQQVSKKLSRQHVVSLWSPPAMPQRDSITARLAERGKPTGTAVLSKVPCRMARLPIEPPWSVSPRFLHTIVQIGQSHIQLCVLYGYSHSQCNPKATEHTNNLLSFILSQVSQVPLPFVICGDFNIDPKKLPCWHSFLQIGATDLASVHQHLYHSEMPVTCNQATRPDTAIFSKEIAPFVSSVRVLGQQWFPTHCPVVVTITFPQPQIFRQRLKLPKTWCEFGPTSEQLHQAFLSLPRDEQVPSLEHWGRTVDNTVDAWLRSQQSDCLPKRLPKKYKGRCQPLRVIQFPVFSPLRKGEHGAFEPSDEILSIPTKRHATQVRRIISLKQRLNFEGHLSGDSPRFPGLVAEWRCILKAPVLSKHFAFWIANQPELGYPPLPLPSAGWLEDLLCLTKHHLNIAMASDRKVFELKRKMAKSLDQKHMGSKSAFSSIRGTPRAPVTQLVDHIEGECVANWDVQSHKLLLHDSMVDRFHLATPIEVNDSTGIIVARTPGCLTLQVVPWPAELPDSVKLKQKHHILAPDEVADKLSEYWVPLWTLPNDAVDTESELDRLLPHLPLHEPIEVDMDLPHLKLAIARLKHGSALGVDGISASELKVLPEPLLLLLLAVFRQYSNGFPKDFMIARTFPLNKVDGIPHQSQTRPITVLAQLYRVWGSMICHQILQQWGRRFPKQITGFLPKRGALLAAYGAQAELEIDASLNRTSSGLTLDLKKCFNLIRHGPVVKVLAALQIPSCILRQWIESIRLLSRFWIIESSAFGPYLCNNGLPEGDVFSVVAMLGIGLCWTSSVMQVSQDRAVAWAYADNWAWKVYQVELHRLVMQATIQVVSAFGLVIDFGKTWFWVSSNQIAPIVKAELELLLPNENVLRKNHAKDLGLEMRYSGANRLGHTTSRYQEGQDRLNRLAKLAEPLAVKEHLLEASIWPATYFGAEFYPVPTQVLQTHRSSAADALFGSSHSLNPAIALLLGAKRILDPAFVCIANALRTARSWLLLQSQEVRTAFFQCAAQANGKPQDVKGPASALRAYLARINWSISGNGLLQVSAFHSCHLVFDSFQRVLRALTLSWQDDFFVLFSQRRALHSLRNPSRIDTIGVLKSLPDPQRRAIVREISGAFQVSSQKAKWIPEATNLCQFCHMEDSRVHRLVECPAFQDVREPFLPMLQNLQELDHPMLWFPMILRHPDAEAHQCLQAQEPMATVCQSAIVRSHQMRHRGCLPRFFTDGSCAHPSHPSSRFSGFSVVMDLAEDDAHRIVLADKYLIDGILPTTFTQVACGKTSWEQNIGRAELQALLTLVEAIPSCIVFTDSSYALGIMQKVQQGWSFGSLSHKDNLDLIRKVLELDISCIQFRKTAAHRCLTDILCPLERYEALGNAYADKCANAACLDYNPPWVQAQQYKHDDIQSDRVALKQLCQLHLQLHRARVDAELQALPEEAPSIGGNLGKTSQQLQRELVQWIPVSGVAYDSTFIPRELRQFFLFGEKWLDLFEQWLQTLQWDDSGQPPFGQVGVSWLEIGLSFSRMAGAYLPIQRTDVDNNVQLIFPASDDADTYEILAADLANSAMQFWNAYHSLMMGGPPVVLSRGLQASLFLVGFRSQTSGFKPRPWMVHADCWAPFLVKLLQDRTSYQFRMKLPWKCDDMQISPVSWDRCKKQLKVGQSLARRLRRAAGNE